MENHNSMTNSSQNVIKIVIPTLDTTKCWSGFRHLKYVVQYHKNYIVLLLILVSLITVLNQLMPRKKTTNLIKKQQANPRLSNADVIQLMMERHEIFEERKKLLQSICQNVTKDVSLSRPRDGTIYFDILWDPHYQVIKDGY